MDAANAERVGRALSDFIGRLMPLWPLVGGAVAVVDRDRTLMQFGFGYADREGGVAATPEHLFQIGSISKTFVSVVVNQLVDEAIIDLDEAITEILPWVDLGDGAGPVTVRQLLSHTGGLILGGDGVPDDLAQLWALRDVARSPEPHQHFHYSNLGYMLLGQAVCARTGSSLAEVLRTRVFGPLGMRAALGCVRQPDRWRMATGYWPKRDDVPWVPGDALTPAAWFEIDAADGNVAASATDMARFARLLLGSGEVDGVRVMSKSALVRMSAVSSPGGEDVLSLRNSTEVTSSSYGLGVNIETINGHTCLTHGGGMVGFQSFLLADRTEGVGIVVLTNANGCYPVAQVIARAGHALLVEGPHVELPPADDPVVGGASADLVDQGWLGEFAALGPDAEIRVVVSREGGARLTLESGGASAPLWRTWTGRYVCSHARFREYRWTAECDEYGTRWTYGPHVFRPADKPRPASASGPDEVERALVGRYRSYSPWFPTFNIFWRDGRLFLAAPGGVEAPEEDCELVRVPGGWRIGAEHWLPERLVAGPLVSGCAISVSRDGVPYSRSVF